MAPSKASGSRSLLAAGAAAVALGTVAAVALSSSAKKPGKFATPDEVGTLVEDEGKKENPEYDFVIIGGGTAAMVLANRLSERPDFNVLVLEAGDSSMSVSASRIPAAFNKLQRTRHDWTYHTTPQKFCDNREMPWTRTKLLGGCSSGNAMMFHLGAPEDYDEWAKAQRDADDAQEWSYDSFSQYLRKFEKFVPHPSIPVDVQKRGNSGPVQTGYNSFFTPVGQNFLLACDAAGIPKVADVNTPAGTLGATRTPTYIDPKGRRVSTESAYLTPDVLARPNLKVVTRALVTRIRTSVQGGETLATGVEFTSTKPGGPTYFVCARKEVLLSAGAVNSPQILMLSGIGPASELKKHDIPLVHDLPGVGQHLRDHLVFNLSFPAKPGYCTRKWLRPQNLWEGAFLSASIAQYLVSGTGPLTSNSQECMAYVRVGDGTLVDRPPLTEDTTSGPGAPDLEVLVSPLAWRDHGHAKFNVGDAMTISSALLRPMSKGTITLKSANPRDAPVVDPNYFSNEHDMEIMIRAVKLSHKLAHTEPLSSLLDHDRHHPLLDHSLAEQSDEEIAKALKARVETLYHPSCTTRMAPLAEGGVVDTQLKVHGIRGLRIVDAGVQPEIVSGHTAGPVIGIAEKAGDLIKGSWYSA